MQIEFEKFLALTTLLAVGAVAVPSCTINSTTTNVSETGGASAGGASSNAGSVSKAGTAGSAGAVGTAGNAGAAITTVEVAGSAGATAVEVAGSAGVAGSSTIGTAGSAGASVSTVATAGSAGAPVNAGGTAGSAGAVSSGGGVAGTAATVVAGTAGTAGALGVAGSAGTAACIDSEPVAEGGSAIDCTKLSYYSTSCPDPSYEGAPYGAVVCDRYALDRQGSAKVLFDCLNALVVPAGGWCTSEHVAAVEACITKMEQSTCASTAAETACATIHAQCSAVTVSQCVADMSPLRNDELPTASDPCFEGSTQDSCAADYRYNCVRIPSPNLATTAACATLTASCPALTADTCAEGLDSYGVGVVAKSAFESTQRCMTTYEASGHACDAAFTNCAY
jgi:hypothetical protein